MNGAAVRGEEARGREVPRGGEAGSGQRRRRRARVAAAAAEIFGSQTASACALARDLNFFSKSHIKIILNFYHKHYVTYRT
jgi:hypothetical protein